MELRRPGWTVLGSRPPATGVNRPGVGRTARRRRLARIKGRAFRRAPILFRKVSCKHEGGEAFPSPKRANWVSKRNSRREGRGLAGALKLQNFDEPARLRCAANS